MSDDAHVEVRLDLDHVVVTVEEATEAVMAALAMRVIERAQLNIRQNDQIDTGFMVNSIYLITRDQSTYSDADLLASMSRTDRNGNRVDHSLDMAPEQALPDDASAGVVVGAVYAIYQENDRAFLYPAAQAAAQEFGGEAEAVYRDALPEEGPPND